MYLFDQHSDSQNSIDSIDSQDFTDSIETADRTESKASTDYKPKAKTPTPVSGTPYIFAPSSNPKHAPRLTSRGTIIVYDNQGGHNYYKYGYSRIIEIDVKTGNLIGFFDGSDDIFFDSNARGYIDYIEDGIYLITSPLDFRVFVINCKKNNNLLSNKCDSEVFLESKKGTEMNIMTKVYHGNFFN